MKTRSLVILAALALILALPAMAAGPDGAAIYKTKCTSCHGADGSGQTPVGKSMKIRDLRSPEVQKQTDIQLTDVIAGGKGKMQGYGKTLSTADIQALIAHIRTLKK
ncbi:MAG TPA: cytochrome c [Thermoanaerobaculia bacterium]|jgi:mono/diheme cytochrome c family protein|nr:cytochrome c [Thermoanaerobaculia bacterium]